MTSSKFGQLSENIKKWIILAKEKIMSFGGVLILDKIILWMVMGFPRFLPNIGYLIDRKLHFLRVVCWRRWLIFTLIDFLILFLWYLFLALYTIMLSIFVIVGTVKCNHFIWSSVHPMLISNYNKMICWILNLRDPLNERTLENWTLLKGVMDENLHICRFWYWFKNFRWFWFTKGEPTFMNLPVSSKDIYTWLK